MFLFFSEQLLFWATGVFLQNSLGLNVLVAFFFRSFLNFPKINEIFYLFLWYYQADKWEDTEKNQVEDW